MDCQFSEPKFVFHLNIQKERSPLEKSVNPALRCTAVYRIKRSHRPSGNAKQKTLYRQLALYAGQFYRGISLFLSVKLRLPAYFKRHNHHRSHHLGIPCPHRYSLWSFVWLPGRALPRICKGYRHWPRLSAFLIQRPLFDISCNPFSSAIFYGKEQKNSERISAISNSTLRISL